MKAMISKLENHDTYQWKIGVKRCYLLPNMLYTIGIPIERLASTETENSAYVISNGKKEQWTFYPLSSNNICK